MFSIFFFMIEKKMEINQVNAFLYLLRCLSSYLSFKLKIRKKAICSLKCLKLVISKVNFQPNFYVYYSFSFSVFISCELISFVFFSRSMSLSRNRIYNVLPKRKKKKKWKNIYILYKKCLVHFLLSLMQ